MQKVVGLEDPNDFDNVDGKSKPGVSFVLNKNMYLDTNNDDEMSDEDATIPDERFSKARLDGGMSMLDKQRQYIKNKGNTINLQGNKIFQDESIESDEVKFTVQEWFLKPKSA